MRGFHDTLQEKPSSLLILLGKDAGVGKLNAMSQVDTMLHHG
jgi:hypothetical protein